MRKLLTIVFICLGLVSFGQKQFLGIVKPITAPSCPTPITLTSVVNLTEDPPETYVIFPTLSSDGNAKVVQTITVTDSARFQSEYQSTSNTDHFALCWDANSSLATSYYSTAKFVVFVYAGYYWYNYNQLGATDSGIPAVNGDLFCLFRDVFGNIYFQYKRGTYWTNIQLMEEANTSVLTQYISAANDGTTAYSLKNPRYCIY